MWPWSYKTAPAKPAARNPAPTLSQLALAEMKRDELEERPFGSYGEMALPASEPPPPAPKPFVIPPPDWDQEERDRLAREHEEAALDEEQPGYPPPRREPS